MRGVGLLLGGVVLLLGWAALVVRAVGAGTSQHWGSTAALGVGAAVCLFLAVLAFARFRAARRGGVSARRTPSHRA